MSGFIKESLSYSGKQIAMAIVPKCGATLSIMGSVYILLDILRSSQKRRKVFSRLVLGMSLSDVVLSTCFFLSTWPAPVGTPGAFMAAGTTQTCTAQGFFSQFAAICTPIYNGGLALYYVLVIRYKWTEKELKRIEPFLHAFPIAVGIATSVTGLVLDLYNYSNWICWIAPLPWGCEDSVRYGETNCIRGNNAWVYQWAFLYAPVWFLIVFVAVGMILVYRKVLMTERKSMRWNFNETPNRLNRSKKVAMQGFLYVLVFLLTWFFATLTRILDLIKNRTYFPIVVTMAFFLPCQGFFNALVYLRPRYLHYIKHNPDQGVWTMLTRCLRTLPHMFSVRHHSTELSEQYDFKDDDYCSLPLPIITNIQSTKTTHNQQEASNELTSTSSGKLELVGRVVAQKQCKEDWKPTEALEEPDFKDDKYFSLPLSTMPNKSTKVTTHDNQKEGSTESTTTASRKFEIAGEVVTQEQFQDDPKPTQGKVVGGPQQKCERIDSC